MAILKVFLHIFDHDRLSHLLGDWTPEIALAVAVSEEGAVHLQIHHVSETTTLPAVIVRRFGIQEGDLVVSQDAPEALRLLVGDVRKVKFSEEKRLIDLVMARPALAEDAADYAINFSFAREEGIEIQPTGEAPADGFGEFPEKLFLTDGSLDSGTEGGLLHFRADRDAMRWCGVMTGSSAATEEGLRVTCGDADAPAPILLSDVHHREDLSEMIAPRDLLATWRHPEPLGLIIPWSLLPEGLRAFAGRPVTIRFSPWWIAVSLDFAPGKAGVAAVEAGKAAAALRRRSGRLALSAMVLSASVSSVVATAITLGAIGAAGLMPDLRETLRDRLAEISTVVGMGGSDADGDEGARAVKIEIRTAPEPDTATAPVSDAVAEAPASAEEAEATLLDEAGLPPPPFARDEAIEDAAANAVAPAEPERADPVDAGLYGAPSEDTSERPE